MVIIRAINTIDAMSATIERIDWDVLQRITERILAEVPNVNRDRRRLQVQRTCRG